jgi:hypothetical protein
MPTAQPSPTHSRSGIEQNLEFPATKEATEFLAPETARAVEQSEHALQQCASRPVRWHRDRQNIVVQRLAD